MTQMHISISEVEKPHTMAIETSSIDFAGPVGKNVRYRYLPIAVLSNQSDPDQIKKNF